MNFNIPNGNPPASAGSQPTPTRSHGSAQSGQTRRTQRL